MQLGKGKGEGMGLSGESVGVKWGRAAIGNRRGSKGKGLVKDKELGRST